jgi:hypothetical protein
MAYSKAKLKSTGGITSPSIKPVLIENKSDRFLPTLILLYVSVKHIFISLISILWIPHSKRILYKTCSEYSVCNVQKATVHFFRLYRLASGLWCPAVLQMDTDDSENALFPEQGRSLVLNLQNMTSHLSRAYYQRMLNNSWQLVTIHSAILLTSLVPSAFNLIRGCGCSKAEVWRERIIRSASRSSQRRA